MLAFSLTLTVALGLVAASQRVLNVKLQITTFLDDPWSHAPTSEVRHHSLGIIGSASIQAFWHDHRDMICIAFEPPQIPVNFRPGPTGLQVFRGFPSWRNNAKHTVEWPPLLGLLAPWILVYPGGPLLSFFKHVQTCPNGSSESLKMKHQIGLASGSVDCDSAALDRHVLFYERSSTVNPCCSRAFGTINVAWLKSVWTHFVDSE